MSSIPRPDVAANRAITRRDVLKALGTGAIALAGLGAPRFVRAASFEPGWTHLAGGGGSLLFYNANTGQALIGTLDEAGWNEGERHDDFTLGFDIVVSTSRGSLLFLDRETSLASSGVIAAGAWSFSNDYDGLAAGWTHAAATADSALLYDAVSGHGTTGTLIDGAWTASGDALDFGAGFTHLIGSDDSLLFSNAQSGAGATGTLTNGAWSVIDLTIQVGTGWTVQAGASDSLLLARPETGLSEAGTLIGGIWRQQNGYDTLGMGWTHGAGAGNGFVVLYDANSGQAAIGTLAGGAWTPSDSTSQASSPVAQTEPPQTAGTPVAVGNGGTATSSVIGVGIPALDDIAATTMDTSHAPGFAVAIAKDGKLVFAKAYGSADRAGGKPLTVATRMRIASVTKPITSTAIQTLVEAGKLSLTDTVFGDAGVLKNQYGTAPYAPILQRITITHLLQHTGGGWSNDGNDPMFQHFEMTADQLISWTIDNRPLDHEPGTTYAYSNFGYCVLGRVIEHVSGQSYADYVRDAVLAKCGVTDMEIAGSTLAERKPGEAAYDGAASTAGGTDPYGIDVARMDSHGGWIATVVDLLRFVVRVDGFPTVPDILSPATIATMTTASAAEPVGANAGYAMGWAVNTINNWWHHGNLPGTEAFLVRASNGICWAAIANGSGIDLETTVWAMVNANPAWPAGDPL